MHARMPMQWCVRVCGALTAGCLVCAQARAGVRRGAALSAVLAAAACAGLVAVFVASGGRGGRAELASDSRDPVGDFYWDYVPQAAPLSDFYSAMKRDSELKPVAPVHETRARGSHFDWDYVPKERPLADDWAGEMGTDGVVRPATCGRICQYCFQGALEGWTYPGGSMAGDACGMCHCEQASAPEWDTWSNEGRCSAELCFACEMGKVTGKPCQSCECGEWRTKRTLEDVCPNRKQVCYSCMSGTLQGYSCNKCQCGHWDEWQRRPTEDRFGAHDCTSVCHHCDIGAIVDPRCDMCFCAQSLDSDQVQPVQWHKRKDLSSAVEDYVGKVGAEGATYKSAQGALEAQEADRGYRAFPEGDFSRDALPVYDWEKQ
jgi:hypothetical protein